MSWSPSPSVRVRASLTVRPDSPIGVQSGQIVALLGAQLPTGDFWTDEATLNVPPVAPGETKQVGPADVPLPDPAQIAAAAGITASTPVTIQAAIDPSRSFVIDTAGQRWTVEAAQPAQTTRDLLPARPSITVELVIE